MWLGRRIKLLGDQHNLRYTAAHYSCEQRLLLSNCWEKIYESEYDCHAQTAEILLGMPTLARQCDNQLLDTRQDCAEDEHKRFPALNQSQIFLPFFRFVGQQLKLACVARHILHTLQSI